MSMKHYATESMAYMVSGTMDRFDFLIFEYLPVCILFDLLRKKS